MKNKEAEKLLNKYLEGNCTEEEKAWVESWYLKLSSESSAPVVRPSKKNKEEIWGKIRPEPRPITIRTLWPKLAAAAVLLIAVGFAISFYIKAGKKHLLVSQLMINDVAAGGKRAVLTLADGSNVILDSASNATLNSELGATIVQSNGRIEYKPTHKAENMALIYNKVIVPRAGEYELVLSDGTRVWLNSGSSLSFPVTFKKHERNVSLTGEAYFEVAKNKKAPFKVFAGGTEVKVLGTHFNVAAYEDEPSVITTLLEGAVRVSKGNQTAKLSPGQQSSIAASSSRISVSSVSAEDAVDWKNGYFTFSGEDIESVMKKVSRWYDVEVVYRASPSQLRFGGIFSKRKKISELLNYLEKLGPNKFKIEERRIIVMK